MKKLLIMMAMMPAMARADVYLFAGLECAKLKTATVDAAFVAMEDLWPGEVRVMSAPHTIKNDNKGMNGRIAMMNVCMNKKCMVYAFTDSLRQCKAIEEVSLRTMIKYVGDNLPVTTDR